MADLEATMNDPAADNPADGVPPGPLSDSLLERVRAREPQAWRRLVQLYGPTVYGWCRRCGLQSADAADAVQEVFTAVAGGIGAFRQDKPGGGFQKWLWTITRSKICDHFRRQKRRATGPGGTALPELTAADADPELPEPDDNSAIGSLVHRALEVVRPAFEHRTWDAFWRVTVEQQAPADVAEDLGMTLPAVYQAKYRVLQRLRQELPDSLD